MTINKVAVESNFTAWKDQLLRDMENCGDGLVWHMILDPNAHQDVPMYLSQKEVDIYVWPLYLNTYSDKLVNSGPQMVRLKPDSAFCQWALALLETVALGIIVGCHQGQENALYENLQSLAEYSEPSGLHRYIFRYYDPRLLYGLTTWPNQVDKNCMMKGALFFEAWEPGRAERIYMEQVKGEAFSFPDDYTVSEELIEHLFAEAHIHSVIGCLDDEPGRILRGMPLPEAYHLLAKAWDSVKFYGFARSDLSFCAAYTALAGIGVWQNENVVLAMQNRKPDSNLRETLETLGV